MKRNVIRVSHSSIVVSLSDIRQERERACSPFGPVRAGLTSSQTTQHQQLSELLNYCLRSLEILQSKYYTDLNTLSIVTKEALAKHSASTIETGGTK
jgi:hypothetical protein